MIFDFIFISKLPLRSSPELEKSPGQDANFISGYIIEDIDKSFSDFFYNSFIFQNSRSFCLAFRKEMFERKMDDATSFFSESFGSVFFNSSYFSLNGYPVIIVLDSPGEGQPASQKKVLDFLQGVFHYLGYDNFYYCFINRDKEEVVSTNVDINLSVVDPEVSAGHNMKNWYLDFLKGNTASRKLIFFFQPQLDSLTDICSELTNAEIEFGNRNPEVFSLLKEQVSFAKNFERYEISIQGLRKDVESRDAYISNLNIPETTLKKLSDFYYYEYEILPLWYKRFGHLIKVFMGKRSFRSLFDDKVKKYKD